MQPQGIRSVMPQGAQAPMPGQAPMQTQPMPGMMPSQSGPKPGLTAFVPSLVGLEIPQMLQLFGDPNSPIPKNRVLAAIVEKQKEMAARKSVQNQMAMQQNAAQQPPIAQQVVAQAQQMQAEEPVMAAHGGEMHGYAGGGAVAFENGGDVQHFRDGSNENGIQSFMERFPKDSGARMLYEWIKAGRPALKKPILDALVEKEQQVVESTTDTGDELSRMLGRAPAPIPPATPPAAAPRPPGATRPGAGTGQPQNRPQAAPSPLQQLGSAVEQTGTPAPDRLAEIEADERARVEGLRGILEAQGKVDPRIVAARKEAAELAQRGIGEREKRAAGALEAAGMPLSQNLFDNQEALFRMLGAMKGGKRIGDAFSNIGQEAGAIRGEQRRALELAQRENRAEQNALDQLRQAQADLKLAQTTGDVQGERNAALKVEEAKANLGLTRLNIQKERATEADRAEQRRLTARGQDLQRLSSQEQMANAIKVAGMQADRTPAEVRLMEWLRNPENKKLYESIQASKRAEDRNLKLYEIYMKNKLLLGDMSFETFAAGLKDASTPGAAPGGALKYNPATGKIE
jgi:hypothetical protein